MSDELKIEAKTKIAADAAITVNAYLEELNERLTENGVENAFSIVSDTQEIIIDILNKVGSPTKLGTDTCMQLIHEELGTPDEFVQQYIQDNNIATSFSLSDNGEKILMKRPRIRKIRKVKPKKNKNGVYKFIKNTIGYSFLITPLILISITLLIRLTQGRFAYNRGNVIFVLSAFSLLFFSLNELFSGFKGKLIASKNTTIKIRYLYRGALIAHFILGFHAYFTSGNYYSVYAAWSFFFAIMFSEILIFLRDHINGLYPLEPEFRKWIRFLTPPYLLLLTALFLFPYSGYREIDFPILVITIAVGIWVKRKNYQVSPRFYIFLFTLQFTMFVEQQYLIPLAFILPLYYIYSFIKPRYNFSFNLGGLNKPGRFLKRKLKEYYEEGV